MSVILQPIVLNEASKAQKLIEQLERVPLGRMYQASFKAVVRLHLYFTGRTHELFLEFSEKAQALILKKAGKDQVLDGASGLAVQSALLKLWSETFKTWSEEFQSVRREAASIPFGVVAVFHERMVLKSVSKLEGSKVEEHLLTEAVEDGVFKPQLKVVLNAAGDRLYGDGLNLSARIWKIDKESQDGINAVLMRGIANGDSAWNIAKELEQFLGAGADCPRWTSTRLYGRTKADIASGDTTGLLRGDACNGSGVSYNAMRLSRTEMQRAHARATDKILASQPWVTAEQIKLSPAHAGNDICDETAQGGENNDGVYPVLTIELPLHPNCMCLKTGVLMPEKQFTSQLNGWLKGEEWNEMDDYAEMIGGNIGDSILPSAISLAVWLFSEDLEKWINDQFE